MNDAMTPCQPDDPLLIAWNQWKKDERFPVCRTWALQEPHVEGSLWEAFSAGFHAKAILSDNPSENQLAPPGKQNHSPSSAVADDKKAVEEKEAVSDSVKATRQKIRQLLLTAKSMLALAEYCRSSHTRIGSHLDVSQTEMEQWRNDVDEAEKVILSEHGVSSPAGGVSSPECQHRWRRVIPLEREQCKLCKVFKHELAFPPSEQMERERIVIDFPGGVYRHRRRLCYLDSSGAIKEAREATPEEVFAWQTKEELELELAATKAALGALRLLAESRRQEILSLTRGNSPATSVSSPETTERYREALVKLAAELTCPGNETHYCPNCDNSLFLAKRIADEALAPPVSSVERDGEDFRNTPSH